MYGVLLFSALALFGLVYCVDVGRRRDQTLISGPAISVSCPQCGKVLTFSADLCDSTQCCNRCGAFVDLDGEGKLINWAHDEQAIPSMRMFSICTNEWSNILSLEEAIQAIQTAFPNASLDSERGQEYANATLQKLRSRNAPWSVQAMYVQYASEAVLVTIPSMDDGERLEFLLMPREGIQLRCRDDRLAKTLANALGYEPEQIG